MGRRRSVKRPISETGFSRRNRELFDEHSNAHARTNGLFWATVEEDHDPQKQGRVKVYIPNLSMGSSTEKPGKKNEEDSESSVGLIWCYPMTPSFGTTDSYGSEDGYANSYGFWGPQPRKGDVVVVGFVNGTMPVWMGCLPKPRKNFMVPGVPGRDHPDESKPAPVTEKAATNPEERPVLSDLNDRIKNAGLSNDRIRGIGTSGSTRESPSRVAGMLTPGHPKDGVPGHSFIMDDLPEQQGIRLRTSRGHQITFSDVSDSIYIATGQGNAWVEISDNGKIDVYSKDSISLHTENDLNVRTDGDYIVDVAGDYLHKVGGDYKLDVGGNTDATYSGYLKFNVGRNYDITTGGNFKLGSTGKIDTISTRNTSISARAQIKMYSTGDLGIDSGSSVKMEQNLASLPSFSGLASSISSTLNAGGFAPTQLASLANVANISSLVGSIDAGVLTGTLQSLGSLSQAANIPLGDLGGFTSAMVANGIDISNIPSQLTNAVDTLNNIASNSGNLSILTNLGLSASDVDISSLGLSTVMDTLRTSGLSVSDATTLFGSDMGNAFSSIVSQGSALTTLNTTLAGVDFNSFRDNATGLRESLITENLNDFEVTAMTAQLSSLSSPTVDVQSALNSFTSTLENPSAEALDIMNRIGIDPASVNLGQAGLLSALDTLRARGLTLSDARGLFGREYGGQLMNIINNAPDVSSIISSFGNLDPSAITNILGGELGDFGSSLADITGLAGNLDLSNIGIDSLSGLLDGQLTDGASPGRVPTTSLPGPPSPQQAQLGNTGGNQTYAARRVPQHEPWKPDGRIVPEAVSTKAPGEKSASDRGVERASERPPTDHPPATEGGGEPTELNAENIDFIVVHCSASTANTTTNIDSIRRDHIHGNGWRDIGYHYVIERDGTRNAGRAENEVGSHVGANGTNYRSIGICMVGGVKQVPNSSPPRFEPEINFTELQFAELTRLLDELEGRYPSAELKGHRDFNRHYPPERRKDCPSFNVQAWRRNGSRQDRYAPPV